METAKAAMTMEAMNEAQEAIDISAASGRIFCANCIHCKLVPTPAGQGRYYLRVRCDAGKWQKKSGEEKIYKYFTVARRSIDYCGSYEDMGEGPEFLKDLRDTLPAMDELYQRPAGD